MKQISTLLCLLFCLFWFNGFSQSETHDFITYDTVVPYQGYPAMNWHLRITRPRNLFTPGSPDTASRPAIITMPGIGEVGSDPNNLTKYGPHYWLNNGWDGSVQLGNGTHYPIIITVVEDQPSASPYFLSALMDNLIKWYHIKPRGVHVGGLSMGAFEWGDLICYAASPGDTHGMSLITSFVALSGQGNTGDGNNSGYNLQGYQAYTVWAQKYGGKLWGMQGYMDERFIGYCRDAMNAGVPGSAYVAYTQDGGGAHCCWNDEYNPFQHDWQCVAPITNGNIVGGGLPSSMGDYKEGSSVFQWMLRQGDTSLVGSGTVVNPTPTANAGSNQTVTLPANSVSLSGSWAESGGNIVNATWTKISGPASYAFNNANIANPTVSNLVVGAYTFQLTVTDNLGTQAVSTMQVTVNQGVSQPASGPSYQALPGTIQAESYANISNAQAEPTLDGGGGSDVGYINQGSWMSYNLNVASAGSYTLNFRLATADGGAGFEVVDASGNVLTVVTMKNSGGWQSWMNITATVNLPAGQQTLKLVSISQANWNINWFSATPNNYSGGYAIPGTVQAENYINMSGVLTESTGDAGGGLDVGWIDPGDWMDYAVNVQKAGMYNLSFRVSSAYNNATFVVQDGSGNIYTTINVPNTGNWQTYTTVTVSNIPLCTGPQVLRLTSTLSNWNINWIQAVLTYSVTGSSVTNSTANTAEGAQFSQDTAVSAAGAGAALRIYPNPVHEAFTLDINNGVTGKVNVQVMSPAGGVLKVFELDKELTEMQWQLSLSGLPAGVYLLHIQSESWQETTKLIKL